MTFGNPPPPPPPPPPTNIKPAENPMKSLFAEINRGEEVTKGILKIKLNNRLQCQNLSMSDLFKERAYAKTWRREKS